MVTNSQLIEYMKNPVSASELANQPYMKCPAILPTGICNGGAGSVVETCSLPEGTFSSCFGCPSSYFSLKTPSPAKTGTRCFVPDNCKVFFLCS
jgi:hypothetical protein